MGWQKLLGLLAIGLLMSGLVIGLVVLLTPLPELTEEEKAAYLAQQGFLSMAAPVEVAAEPSKPAGKPERLSPTIVLPTKPEMLETQVVHSNVKKMSEWLIAKYPNDPGSWHIAAQAYAELNQSEKAEEYWRKCIALKPQHFGPYLGLADVLTEKGRFQDSVDVLNQVFSLGGSAPEVYTKLGEALENLGQIPEAKLVFEKGYDNFPEETGFLLRLGRTQVQTGELELAEHNIREAIRREGETQQNLLALNSVLARLNKRDEIAVVREKLKAISQPEQKIESTATSFQEGYERALTGSMSQIYESAASLCLQQKDFEDAEKLYMQSLRIDPRWTAAIKGLSGVYLDTKRWEDLIVVLQELIEREPDQLIHRVNLASALVQVGDVEAAEQALLQALKKDPSFVLGKIALCKLYLGANQAEKGVELIREVADASPDKAVYLLQAAILEATGDAIGAQVAKQNADRISVGTGQR